MANVTAPWADWVISTRVTKLGNRLDGFRNVTFFTAYKRGAPVVKAAWGYEREGVISDQGGIRAARAAIAKATAGAA
jgi:hypothetical protein